MSKTKFRTLLNVDAGSAGRFYRKGYNPTLETLDKFAKALGVKIKDLIED